MSTSPYKFISSLIIAFTALVAPMLVPTEALAKMNYQRAERLLIQMGLNPTQCVTNVITVLYGEDADEICAFPNAKYPTGVYRLDPINFKLHPIDGEPDPTPQVVIYPSPIPSPIALPPDPTMIYMPNPMQPIPTHIQARLATVRSSHQLAPARCGNDPNLVVINVNYTYRMCAYPTSNHPGGRSYSIEIPNLGNVGYPVPHGNPQMIRY
ncbi:MAG: hypothetical protein AB4058_10930 [Microcystaceae cyanobacterium]